ncbi:unnamed protein product, partial [Prorocentrum cordatum]
PQVLRAVHRRFCRGAPASGGGGGALGPEEEGGPDALGERLRAALLDEAPTRCEAEDIRLSFVVRVSAKYWIGKGLATPRFPAAPAGVSEGLRAWRRLSGARALVHCGHTNRHTSLGLRHSGAELDQAWRQLRDTYLDIWAEAGLSRSAASARLSALERKAAVRRRLAGAAVSRVPSHGGNGLRGRGSASGGAVDLKMSGLLRRWARREARAGGEPPAAAPPAGKQEPPARPSPQGPAHSGLSGSMW